MWMGPIVARYQIAVRSVLALRQAPRPELRRAYASAPRFRLERSYEISRAIRSVCHAAPDNVLAERFA